MSIPTLCRCGCPESDHDGADNRGACRSACVCYAFDTMLGPKAQAWDECCEAFAWALVNGPARNALDYVSKHNPYAGGGAA